ncbi:MAG: trigger factor [Porphyromonadaceae bacterium]|nr:MAG: trigger factor [Porphyromonadaceae bacterium]
MNISRENSDDLNAVIRIGIEPVDYQPKVDAALSEYRKKARFDGFRPGKVPSSLVKKIYGKSIQAEKIQHLLSDTLNSYIQDNKLKVLGEPLPNVNSPEINWDNQESFEFHFDIAMAPDIELKISENDKINDYRIIITPEMIDKQIADYSRRFGSLQPTDTISEEDVVTGDLCELSDHDHEHTHEHSHEDDHDHHHPVHSHGAFIYIKTIGDETVKNQFLESKVGDKLIFNPNVAFPNETDRASLLKVSREELGEINTDFEFTINEVSRFTAAEIDQKLFDKAFGEGTIDSAEAFRERIEEDLERQVSRESQYKFHRDAKEKLIADTFVPLPEEFLKRWMLLTSKKENLTREQLEKDFPAFVVDLKWRMIKNTIIGDQKLEATDEEIREQAIWAAQSRYFQYGIYNAPPEQLFRLSDVLLKNEEEKTRIADVILENKVIEYVKTLFGLEEQNISLEEFNKLMDENKR